jgi:hypothetical protein
MRRVRVWGYLECIEDERGVQIICGVLSERSHLEELDIDMMKLLKLIFKK